MTSVRRKLLRVVGPTSSERSPVVDFRARDRRHHLPVKLPREPRQAGPQILYVAFAHAVRFLPGNDLLH